MILDAFKNTLFEDISDTDDRFERHFHQTYTIGITHRGLFKSYQNNKAFLSYKASTRVINPYEIHNGKSTKWQFTNFYPTITLMREIYKEIFFEEKTPLFSKHIIEDLTLYEMLLSLFRSVYAKESSIIIETQLIQTLSYLILHYTTTKKDIACFDDKKVIKTSLEFIHDNLDENISLDDIAKSTHLSKYHFLRLFKKNTGTTPHNYILTQRVNLAMGILLKEKDSSRASFQAGFSDQSHFIRSFKKMYGYTPANLFKNSNIILYR